MSPTLHLTLSRLSADVHPSLSVLSDALELYPRAAASALLALPAFFGLARERIGSFADSSSPLVAQLTTWLGRRWARTAYQRAWPAAAIVRAGQEESAASDGVPRKWKRVCSVPWDPAVNFGSGHRQRPTHAPGVDRGKVLGLD